MIKSQAICQDTLYTKNSFNEPIQFSYYPMMAIDNDPIKCIATDKRNMNHWIKQCMELRCTGFMVLKDDIILHICYYKTDFRKPLDDNLIDASFILDQLYNENHYWKNVCLGSYLLNIRNEL